MNMYSDVILYEDDRCYKTIQIPYEKYLLMYSLLKKMDTFKSAKNRLHQIIR